MKKIMKILLESGIWLQPLIMALAIKGLESIGSTTFVGVRGTAFLISLLPFLIVYAGMGKRPNEKDAISGKEKAIYPAIPKKMLSKEPKGIVLGRDKRTKQYVCKRLEEDGHVFVVGGSGSGKSSCLAIPAILVNPEATIFALDIKGELHAKATRHGDKKVRICDPANRKTYGYNPFYRLREKSTKQDILEVMQGIAASLIPLPANLKDPFWKLSARNLLTGLLIYHYRTGCRDFVTIMDEILGKPIKESIKLVISHVATTSAEYRYIVQFEGMEEATLGGIVAEMNNHLVIFSNDQDIRYALRDNGRKCNPYDLEKGISIYISISEDKLNVYYDVLQLIINQTLEELEKRKEDSEPIVMLLDELPRILSAGKLDKLLDAARTLRSRKVVLFLVSQSIEALMIAYGENEVVDLISNCSYIVVLSATSMKTQKMVCDWSGKYRARKKSWNGNGKDSKTTVSYEDKDIVESKDLMILAATGEAILITPHGYCRVEKTPYYMDEKLKEKSREIAYYNQAIIN